jgi:hypothetical protein
MSVTIHVDRVEKVVFQAGEAEIENSTSHFVIEAIYNHPPAGAGAGWDLDLLAAKRVAYSFSKGPAPLPLQIVDSPADLRGEIQNDDPVLYWLTHPPAGNALVSVGQEDPLNDLALRGAPQANLDVNLVALDILGERLVGPGTTVRSLTVYLESADGDSYPLPISNVAHVNTALEAKQLFGEPRLVLLADGPNTYRAILAVDTGDVFGPPEEPKEQKCDRWAQEDGWVYGLVRTVNGCPR